MITSTRIRWILYITLVAVRVIGANYFHFYDDAYITLRYARNLIEGNGFVFNPGEWVLGITTPLWGLIGAALHLLPIQIEHSVLAISIIADLGTLYVTNRSFRSSGKPIAATYFALLFAASGVLNRIGVSGMESSLFLFAVCLAVSRYHEGYQKQAVVIAAIAYFLRPEAVLLVGALVLRPLLSKRDVKLTALLALIGLAVVAPFLWMLYHYYGTIIPQSMLAKATVEKWSLWLVIKELMLSDPLCFILLPLTLYGAAKAWKSEMYGKLWVAWIGAFVLAYLVARPAVFKWYGEPVHYGEMLFAAYALQALFASRAAGAKILKTSVVSGLAAAIVLVWASLFAMEGKSQIQQNRFYAFRDYFRAHSADRDTVLCGDIGAIGYFSRAYIIDPYGLVTPEALQFDSLPATVAHYKPKYFLAYELPWMIRYFKNNPWILDQYELVHHFNDAGHPMDSIVLDESQYKHAISGFYLLERRSHR